MSCPLFPSWIQQWPLEWCNFLNLKTKITFFFVTCCRSNNKNKLQLNTADKASNLKRNLQDDLDRTYVCLSLGSYRLWKLSHHTPSINSLVIWAPPYNSSPPLICPTISMTLIAIQFQIIWLWPCDLWTCDHAHTLSVFLSFFFFFLGGGGVVLWRWGWREGLFFFLFLVPTPPTPPAHCFTLCSSGAVWRRVDVAAWYSTHVSCLTGSMCSMLMTLTVNISTILLA